MRSAFCFSVCRSNVRASCPSASSSARRPYANTTHRERDDNKHEPQTPQPQLQTATKPAAAAGNYIGITQTPTLNGGTLGKCSALLHHPIGEDIPLSFQDLLIELDNIVVEDCSPGAFEKAAQQELPGNVPLLLEPLPVVGQVGRQRIASKT